MAGSSIQIRQLPEVLCPAEPFWEGQLSEILWSVGESQTGQFEADKASSQGPAEEPQTGQFEADKALQVGQAAEDPSPVETILTG